MLLQIERLFWRTTNPQHFGPHFGIRPVLDQTESESMPVARDVFSRGLRLGFKLHPEWNTDGNLKLRLQAPPGFHGTPGFIGPLSESAVTALPLPAGSGWPGLGQ